MEEDDDRERGRGWRRGDEDSDSEVVTGVDGEVGGTDASRGTEGGGGMKGEEREEPAVDCAIRATRGVGQCGA